MCGIVGYIGHRNAEEVILTGLRRLEYRGYDSAGIAVIHDKKIDLKRSEGKIDNLAKKVHKKPATGHLGIGHTRWATHGRPNEENAHPHVEGGVAVAHNGIIENYLALKEELKKTGAKFKSETDTEIISHLIHRQMEAGLDLEGAVRESIKRLKGAYAIAVVSKDEPGKIVGAKQDCPLVVGIGENEAVLSSDITAILDTTRKAVFLEDGEMVVVTKDSIDVTTFDGKEVSKKVRTIDWNPAMAEKEGYRHFMLKEIHEQPRAVTDTFRGLLMEEDGDVFLNEFNIDLKAIERVYIIACGTSWHASLVGKFLIEELAKIPVEVDLASEFRYRHPIVGKNTLVIAVSQSGETADTLAAVKEVKRKGSPVIGVCNVVESAIARESTWTLYTHAGPEIGVASTKAFTTQLSALLLIAIYAGRRLERLDKKTAKELIQELLKLPHKIEKTLLDEKHVEEVAKKYFHARDFLYLGRGVNYPIALEGALKLKEISYIHAEGYPAGEMKHGPIALIDEALPVVVIAIKDAHYPKILGNIEEVKARGGKVIAIVNEDDKEVSQKADDTIVVPHAPHLLTPVLTTVPLQLLAYHIAVLKGTDVDQPRNLAKSVTVE